MRLLHIALFLMLGALVSCAAMQGKNSATVENAQTRSVDAIRDIGTAVEAYKLNNSGYPISKSGHLEEIQDKLVPTFLEKLVMEDGWGNNIEYYCLQSDGPYYIISLGADKERDVGLYKSDRTPSGLASRIITDVKEDIIFSNGSFVRHPQDAGLTSRK